MPAGAAASPCRSLSKVTEVWDPANLKASEGPRWQLSLQGQSKVQSGRLLWTARGVFYPRGPTATGVSCSLNSSESRVGRTTPTHSDRKGCINEDNPGLHFYKSIFALHVLFLGSFSSRRVVLHSKSSSHIANGSSHLLGFFLFILLSALLFTTPLKKLSLRKVVEQIHPDLNWNIGKDEETLNLVGDLRRGGTKNKESI